MTKNAQNIWNIESNDKEYLENMKDDKDCLENRKDMESNDKECLENMEDRKKWERIRGIYER